MLIPARLPRSLEVWLSFPRSLPAYRKSPIMEVHPHTGGSAIAKDGNMNGKTLAQLRTENASIKNYAQRVKESRDSAWWHANSLWSKHLELVIEGNRAAEALQQSEVEMMALSSEVAQLREGLDIMLSAYFGLRLPTGQQVDAACHAMSLGHDDWEEEQQESGEEQPDPSGILRQLGIPF